MRGLSLLLLLGASPALGQHPDLPAGAPAPWVAPPPAPRPAPPARPPTQAVAAATSAGGPAVSLHGAFATFADLRNDSDFDRTDRYFDRDGQSQGQVATFLRASFGLELSAETRILYEGEIGWAVWSRHDAFQPDPFDDSTSPGISLRHRQLWAEWRPHPSTGARIGYQEIADPSHLFIDYLAGAASFDQGLGGVELGVRVGQLPDDTLEGVDATEDNFTRDNVFVAATATWARAATTWDAQLWYLDDRRVIDAPLRLGTAVAGVRHARPGYAAWAHVLGQLGAWRGAGVAGEDVTVLAWAAQAGMRQTRGRLHWGLNVVARSGDDDHDGNTREGAFFSSGRNHSRTRLLTEDELHDRYDNLDERMATPWGAFFVDRAGLTVADVALGYRVAPWYTPALVLGTGVVHNPNNALGSRFAGAEATLENELMLDGDVSFVLSGLLFLPGRAAAARVNDVDREATDPLFGGSADFRVRF